MSHILVHTLGIMRLTDDKIHGVESNWEEELRMGWIGGKAF